MSTAQKYYIRPCHPVTDALMQEAALVGKRRFLSVDDAYFEYAKWARRFCCQQASVLAVQKGFSLP
jgi:hypothetical protein